MIGRIFVAIFLGLLGGMLISCSSSDLSTQAEATRAKLRIVRAAFNYCRDVGLQGSVDECINGYLVSINVRSDEPMFMYDTFGELLVFGLSEECKVKVPGASLPYSKGPDKLDDCGLNDDIK